MIFGLLKRVVKGALRGTLLVALLAATGLGYGYYRLAMGRLAAPPGTVVTAGVVRGTPSLTGGTLPVTFEAFLKDRDAHNWLATARSTGLVKARYEWSHGRFEWVEDAAFGERQTDSVRERKKLASRDVDALIRDLRSEDAIAREVSAKELCVRTGETHGYAYDAPRVERERAAAAWDAWWADDRNRLRYRAARGLDAVDDALGTLRRALGQPEGRR